MAEYAITFARSARRELEALETKVVARIFQRIEALGKEPRPSGCKNRVDALARWREMTKEVGRKQIALENKDRGLPGCLCHL